MKRLSLVFLLCVICVICGPAFAKKHSKPSPGGGGAQTPLTITTIGLQNGQVGQAYSQTITASGGTTPYTFAVTSCSGATGCPPPSIALTTGSPSATLAGTPTADGIYSFTVRATDSAAHTYSLSYALTIAASPAPSAPLFQDNFESGNFAAWTYKSSSAVTINANPAYVHTGSDSMQIHYFLCGDSNNPLCGSQHLSSDEYVSKGTFGAPWPNSTGLDHFFIRGYVMFATPLAGETNTLLQRKVFYLKDPGAISGGTDWSVVVGGAPGSLHWFIQGGGVTYCNAPPQSWTLTTYQFDTWYSVEIEVQANTPGLSDGTLKLWIDGTKILDQGNVNMRGTCSTGIVRYAVGEQVDRFNYNVVDEYRYWDDIVISATGPIGP